MNPHLTRIILRTVGTYVLVASAWILFSDRLVGVLFADRATLLLVSIIKGWVFVVVTAALLYGLLYRALRRDELLRARLVAREEQFRNVFDSVRDAIFIHHPLSGVILDANQRAADLYGYSREEICAMDIGQLSSGSLPYTLSEAKCRLLRANTEGPQQFDWMARDRAGRQFWVEVSLHLTRLAGQEVVLAMVHDIRERKALEQATRRRQAMFVILSGVNQAIIHARSRDELFSHVCLAMLKTGLFHMAWFGSAQQGLQRHVVPLVSAGEMRGFLDELSSYTWQQLIEADTPAGRAWRTREPQVENDFSTQGEAPIAGDRLVDLYGTYSEISLPISGGGFQGTLTAYSSVRNLFDDEMIGLMHEVANDVSFALRTLRESERQVATMERLKLYARVFDESRDGILITDSSNVILMANRALTQMFGYELEELQGQNPRLLRSGRYEAGFYRQMWDALMDEGGWQGEVWDRRKDGELIPCWVKIYVIRDGEGQIVNYFEVFSDLAEHQAREELQWLRRFDPLTRLPNRLELESRAHAAIMQARQNGDRVGLLSINLDHFHYVNESLGHSAGDEALKIMAGRFAEAIGESGTLARLSGGAFVALLHRLDDNAEAENVAARLLRAATQVYELDGVKISQTTCIGIAVYPADGEDFITLLKHADAARVEAMEGGGNHYRFYIEDFNDRVRARLSLSADLFQALEHERFVLHYQPQVDARTGRVQGVEALLRLQHPTRGLVLPGEFIQVAEESGLIVRLGSWVIAEACRQLQRWRQYESLSMSINLSPLQLQDRRLLDTISQVIEATRLDPLRIEFEFTESALMRNSTDTLALMHRLKGLGVRLAIDDFGTGYSNLSYLKQFPIDRLKIDRSFVCGVPDDQNDNAIVQAILAVARALGLATIGEGIETLAQAEYLREQGCDEFQGYLFAPPRPAEELESWFRHDIRR
jgi:diguanylate cyclase (GGDEF)-like protein/PAS domain S-box-containing protein